MTAPGDGGRRSLILAAVMAGGLLGPVDASIVNVVLPTLSRAFSASLAAVQWVPMVYLLASGSLVLFFGRLGDLRGHRRVFLAGLLAFVVASLLCAAAPTSVPLAILTATFPPAERGKAIGFFAASISVGLALGPSLGGLLTATFGWRAAFLVNLPLGLSAFAFARRVLPEHPGRPGRLDLPGAATALGALGAFLLSRILGEGAGRVGLVLTAFPLAVLCVAPFAGALSDRIGTALPAAAGASISAVACALLAAMPEGPGTGGVAWRLALFGAGTGLFQSPNNSAVMGSAPKPHLGVVASVLGTSRAVGMVLGVAAAGVVVYAFVPASALRDGTLAPDAAAAFAAGVRRAYAAGAAFATASALLASARGGSRCAMLPA